VAELIDTHAHLFYEHFEGDLPEVIARARAAGVVGVVAIGTTAESSARCAELAGRFAGVWATAGVHPNEALQAGPDARGRVAALLAGPRVVGVGETGLDRHWKDTPFDVQEEWFAWHLERGREAGMPVVIHCRDAEADMLRALRGVYDAHGPIKGVMHSFVGTAAAAEAYVAMGLHLSFAGMLTYKNAAELRAVAAKAPRDRLLVETDSPYLPPVPMRGKRNEPAYVRFTAEALAQAQGMSLEELAAVTTRNARALFGLAE
jgi:TatD DNase family protein